MDWSKTEWEWKRTVKPPSQPLITIANPMLPLNTLFETVVGPKLDSGCGLDHTWLPMAMPSSMKPESTPMMVLSETTTPE